MHSADISGYGFIDKDEFKKQIDEWIQYFATQPAPAPTALDTSLRALGKHREFLAALSSPGKRYVISPAINNPSGNRNISDDWRQIISFRLRAISRSEASLDTRAAIIAQAFRHLPVFRHGAIIFLPAFWNRLPNWRASLRARPRFVSAALC